MGRGRLMGNLDIKRLEAFLALYQCQSVTAAALQIGVSQSTLSFTLAKLREVFADPLFVRSGQVLVPTERARALAPQVHDALQALRSLMEPTQFNPQSTVRHFRLSMTDISHIVLMPRLLTHLRAVAPGVRLDVQRLTVESGAALAGADADLALGYLPMLDAGFYRQGLFMQTFVCLQAHDHPRLDEQMTREAYEREGHVDVAPQMSSQLVVQEAVQRAGLRREVVVRLPNYLGLSAIVAQTDLIATVPQRLAEQWARLEALRVSAPPFACPTYEVSQYWHERFHRDPAHRWLRQTIAELFKETVHPDVRPSGTAR